MGEKKLNERALLLRLSIGQWTARKQDKKIKAEVEQQYNATDAISVHKALIAKSALETISKKVTQVRDYVYTHTLPWVDEGVRLVPAVDILSLSQTLREEKQECEKLFEEFVANYPAMIETARASLNGLFNEADYPNPAKVARKFYMEFTFEPIPESAGFVSLQGFIQNELDDMSQNYEDRVRTATAAAMKDLYMRLHKVISAAHERLIDPDNKFKDSLVSNIVELVNLLPRLNVTGDEELERLRREAEEKLTKYDAQSLRDYPMMRKEVADGAADLLKKMEGYV